MHHDIRELYDQHTSCIEHIHVKLFDKNLFI
jgi:hypothetical protein